MSDETKSEPIEQDPTTAPRKRKRWIRRSLIAIIAIVGIWVLGDFTYSKIVENAVAEFESTIERDKDGIQVGARSWTLPAREDRATGKKTNAACLLVHGFNDTPQTYEMMGTEISRAGYTARAVRLPGFGVHVDKMKTCTHEQWVEKVIGETKKLREKYDSVFIVGHSLGGAVTIAAALERPDLYDGVVLLAPAIDVSDRRSPLLPTRFWQELGNHLLYFSTVYQSPYDRNDCNDPEHCNPAGKPPFSTRNIVEQLFELMTDNLDRAPEIKLPVFMALSRDDQVIDWRDADGWFEKLGSKNKLRKFYDRSGHALTVDYDWRQVTDDAIEFFRPIVTSVDPDADDPANANTP